MMEIPKNLRLNGETVKIRIVNGKQLERKAGAPNAAGMYEHSTKTVFLSHSLPPREQFETLLHELFHFAQYQFLDVAKESLEDGIFLGGRIGSNSEEEGDYLCFGEESLTLQLEYVFSDFLEQLGIL